jgi:DNA/RNA-binding domain of Phe-tRNA-synthetase-like protein
VSRVRFWHDERIWREYPQLVPAVLRLDGVTADGDPGGIVASLWQRAAARLADTPVGQLPEIQAWRRVFAQMGLKPTQYRCASESLLRRFGKEGSLPRIHPLVDLCNALSLAYAVPVAAFDLDSVSGDLQVRHADGTEDYLTFADTTEHPETGEVVFADAGGNAHARRWSNRQSGRSAIRDSTARVLIVAEAMHEGAADDVAGLVSELTDGVTATWPAKPVGTTLSASAPHFDF